VILIIPVDPWELSFTMKHRDILLVEAEVGVAFLRSGFVRETAASALHIVSLLELSQCPAFFFPQHTISHPAVQCLIKGPLADQSWSLVDQEIRKSFTETASWPNLGPRKRPEFWYLSYSVPARADSVQPQISAAHHLRSKQSLSKLSQSSIL